MLRANEYTSLCFLPGDRVMLHAPGAELDHICGLRLQLHYNYCTVDLTKSVEIFSGNECWYSYS